MTKIIKQNNSTSFSLSQMNSNDLKDAFIAFINAKKEYEITKEQEITKRKAIDMSLEKYMTKVNETKYFLVNHLSEQYSLRRETMEQLFLRLDRALDENKDAIAIQVLSSLEGILKESPLKEIDNIGKAFDSGSEIEI